MLVKVVTVKLRVTEESAAALAETFDLFNAVCNRLSQIAWETKTFRAYDLHRAAYHDLRAQFGLNSQLTVRAIAKVADSYKTDRSLKHLFGPRGAVVYDARCFKLKNLSSAELTTVRGRRRFVMAHGGKQRAQLAAGSIGEADLLFRDGNYYLALSVKTAAPPVRDPQGFLGVDLGIQNIAADSDGTLHAGGKLRRYRKRCRRTRRRLQALRTRGARRLLVKRRRKERRHATHVNHCISKKIVAAAEGTGRGVAVEDLTGIRDRTTVRKAQRDKHSGWAFHQLRSFLEYKCADKGVPFVAVDARNTSRTCPACGCVDKRNRPSQAEFRCIHCALSGHADVFAAQEVARRATVSWPNCRAGDGPLERTPKCAIGKATLLGVSTMPPRFSGGVAYRVSPPPSFRLAHPARNRNCRGGGEAPHACSSK
jgi:putative transposase